jgi:hypothetical protein
MRPGMPLGRKHFRRSRDAPIRKRTCDRPLCQRSLFRSIKAVRNLPQKRLLTTLDTDITPVKSFDE